MVPPPPTPPLELLNCNTSYHTTVLGAAEILLIGLNMIKGIPHPWRLLTLNEFSSFC